MEEGGEIMDFHIPRALGVLTCVTVAGIASHGAGSVYYNPPETGDQLWRFALLVSLTCLMWGATFILAGLPDDTWKD